MLRTCSYGALAPEPWRASQQGGNDVFRCPRIYAADSYRSRSAAQCTKHQKSTANLVPGLMLYWCMACRRCIFFHVMPDAESPRCAPQPRTKLDAIKSITPANSLELQQAVMRLSCIACKIGDASAPSP